MGEGAEVDAGEGGEDVGGFEGRVGVDPVDSEACVSDHFQDVKAI